MRKLFLLLLFSPCFSIAQSWKGKPDSVWFEKKNYYYMGIQSNLLLQQFISFNSNSSINNNPYLFSYSINHGRTGHGFALGTGVSVNESSSNDGVASIHIQNANGTVRIGYEKKFLQQQKFIPFYGVEFGMGGIWNKTTSTLNQSFNNSTSSVETTKWFFGPSFRSGLNYAITRHILVGTEFFFNVQLAFTTTRTENNGVINTASSSGVPFNVGFQAPTALFLMFRY